MKNDVKKVLVENAVAYAGLKSREKAFKKDMDKLNVAIKSTLLSEFPTAKSDGCVFTADHLDKEVQIALQARKSVSLVPEAIEVLKKNKLNQYVEKTEIVRTDLLEADITSGKISQKLIDKLYVEKDAVLALVVKVETKE